MLSPMEAVTAKSHGAAGDGREISVITQSGSNIYESQDAFFSSLDVGKILSTRYGALGGQPIVTTITGFVDSTHVTCAYSADEASSGPGFFGTDDTSALQNAINDARAIGSAVWLGTGMFICGTLVANGAFSLSGFSCNTSFLVFFSPDTNLSYSDVENSPYAVPYPSISLSDLSIRAGYAANSSPGLIDVVFSNCASPQRYATIDNVAIGVLDAGLGFDVGMQLHNATNFLTRDVLIAGYGHIRAGSVGLKVSGDTKPIDMYNFGLRVSFFDTGISVTGNDTYPKSTEGIVFVGCLVIICNRCISCVSGNPVPYVHISDCNFNGYVSDIQLSNIIQYQITNNLFYSVERMSTPEENWVGIEIDNLFSIETGYSGGRISGNIFSGANTPSTTRRCVTVNGSSGSDTGCAISNNTFYDADYGVILYDGSNNVTITDDNVFSFVSQEILNIGANNIVAVAELSANGFSINNHGIKDAWGGANLTLDGTLRANVIFTSPFTSVCWTVVATQTAATSLIANHSIIVDNFTPSGFSVYVPGASNGSTFNIGYMARGI